MFHKVLADSNSSYYNLTLFYLKGKRNIALLSSFLAVTLETSLFLLAAKDALTIKTFTT